MSHNQASHGTALVRWVGLAIGLPALIAVILLGKDALVVVDKINESALQRERVALERGIKLLGDLHASEVLSQTMWDTAFRNVVLSKRQDWIRENFGKEALSSEGVQQLYIVDGGGKVIFSSEIEAAPPPNKVAPLLAAAQRPIERAKALYKAARSSGEGFDERLPGAMTDGIYVNDMIRIGGQSAMITVSPFTPDAEDQETPQEPTLLLGVQVMTETLLDKLESLSHINGLEHVSAHHTALTGEHSHAIRDAQGNVVTHVTWDFSSPGVAILRAALPAIALSLGLIALMTLVATFTVRRLTRRLAESEQAAIHASRHDAATGLANRGWFMNVFTGVLTRSGKQGGTFAVMLIDCDYFKTVNDTLGHAAGDAILRAIAARLKGLDGRLTIAARLGGDEFAAVTTQLASRTEAATAARLLESTLMQPVTFEGRELNVSVSVGAAVFETPSTLSIDAWLAKADMALYRAKRDGRGCSRIYDASLDTGEMSDLPDIRQLLLDMAVPARKQTDLTDRAA
jgi:diguanylate cyclase (GGDEF)-like protein